jgi:uncharacterized protein with GYD domain
MPHYVVLSKLTDQGMRQVKDAPDRLRRGEEFYAQQGVKLIAFYLTMGEYDEVALLEAPDDATLARVLLATGSQGALRTTTLRAFPREEFEQIIGSLA